MLAIYVMQLRRIEYFDVAQLSTWMGQEALDVLVQEKIALASLYVMIVAIALLPSG